MSANETAKKKVAGMTVDELRAELEEANCAVPDGAKKADLVALVEATRGDTFEPTEAEGETVEVEGEVVAEELEVVAEAESKALALREEPVVQVPALLPSVGEFQAMREMASAVANTQMVPVDYRGKPDDVLAAILTGREMGLGPMQSLRDIYVVDGKPSLAANLLLARLREGGIVILESESTRERAWIRAKRRDTGEIAEVEWTMEEARLITTKGKPLTAKDNWKNYPADMLWARNVGRLARRLGPDLIGAAMPYTSEEVQDWDSWDAADKSSGYGGDAKTGTWAAPASWREIGERYVSLLGADDAKAWLGEVAQKGYRRNSVGAIVADQQIVGPRKEDLARRLNKALQTLEGVEGELPLRPDARALVADALSAAFDRAITPEGPPWRLSPTEEDRPVHGIEPPTTELPVAEPGPKQQPEPEPEPPAEETFQPDADGNANVEDLPF